MLVLRHWNVLTCILPLFASACPSNSPTALEAARAAPKPAAAAPTHSGLVSLQDVSIANAPQAGHGLTVIAAFTPLRAPDFEEQPGSPLGCKVTAYDLTSGSLPAEHDAGTLHVAGVQGGDLRCAFMAGRGYLCPMASGRASASVEPGAGTTVYALEGLQLGAASVGRYLALSGAEQTENNGAFAILEVSEDGALTLANPRARPERFEADYTVLAGAGPTPGDRYAPFAPGATIRVALEPGAESAFEAFDVTLGAGGAFELDEATQARITHVEPEAQPLTLGCSHCEPAAVSVIRINTTDADVTGLGPSAMPAPQRSAVEIQCASTDAESVTVPAAAMEYLHQSHARSPITRIRTAFMRDEYTSVGGDTAGRQSGNRVTVLVGRGVLGFSTPRR